MAAAPATSFASDHSLAKAGRDGVVVGTGGRKGNGGEIGPGKRKANVFGEPRQRRPVGSGNGAGGRVCVGGGETQFRATVRPTVNEVSETKRERGGREDPVRIPIIATPLIDAPGDERALRKSQHATTSPPLDVRGTLRDDVG